MKILSFIHKIFHLLHGRRSTTSSKIWTLMVAIVKNKQCLNLSPLE